MKKRICIVLTFVLLALCLTACAAKPQEADPPTPSFEALQKDMADFSDLTGLRKEDITSVYLFSSDTGKEMEITDPAQVKAIVEKFDVAYRFVRVEEPLVGPPSIGFHTAQGGFGFAFGTGEIYRKIPDDKLHNMLVYAPADPSCLAYAKALLDE